MKRKGQAAMEFLMTYGWAILVVLAAIAALAYFGVLSPSTLLPERTTFTAPLANVDSALIENDGTVEIAFRNNVGTTITILNATGTYNGTDDCLNPTSLTGDVDTPIGNGEGFLIAWNCSSGSTGDRFKAGLTFSYINQDTDQTRKHTGTVSGKYQ